MLVLNGPPGTGGRKLVVCGLLGTKAVPQRSRLVHRTARWPHSLPHRPVRRVITVTPRTITISLAKEQLRFYNKRLDVVLSCNSQLQFAQLEIPSLADIEQNMHCLVNINAPNEDKHDIPINKEQIKQQQACCLMAGFACKIFDAAGSVHTLKERFDAEKHRATQDQAKLLPVIGVRKILERWYTEV